MTTPGFTSGTAAITGDAFGSDDDNYAVAFGYRDSVDASSIEQLSELSYFDLPVGYGVLGAQFTNTTYSALSMQQGDAFAKQFGGPNGDDPDFFQLEVFGSAEGVPLAETVQVMLADFRFTNNDDDYILTEWTEVDLSSLSSADRVYFNLSSSDVGSFGMNTPAYFAIDEIQLTGALSPIAELDSLCQSVASGESGFAEVRALLEEGGMSVGDADLNGMVEFADFLALSESFGSTTATWSQGRL